MHRHAVEYSTHPRGPRSGPGYSLAYLAEIKSYAAEADRAARQTRDSAGAAGDRLIEAKALVKKTRGHGAWLPWLRDHCR